MVNLYRQSSKEMEFLFFKTIYASLIAYEKILKTDQLVFDIVQLLICFLINIIEHSKQAARFVCEYQSNTGFNKLLDIWQIRMAASEQNEEHKTSNAYLAMLIAVILKQLPEQRKSLTKKLQSIETITELLLEFADLHFNLANLESCSKQKEKLMTTYKSISDLCEAFEV